MQLDITDPASVDAAVAAAVDRFGRIDVLVNNAGNFYAGYFEEISPAQMRAQIETNLFGPMNVTRAVLPVMRRQRSGHVVTISSTAGLIGQEFVAAYAASKFGVEGWMESLRFDVEPFGIHTTIVEPGFFRTELLVEGSSTIWPELSIDDYADRTQSTIEAWRGMNGQQGGDPAKLAAALVTHHRRSTSRRSGSSPAPTPSPPSSRRPTTSSPRSTPTATCPPTSPTTTSRHDHPTANRDEWTARHPRPAVRTRLTTRRAVARSGRVLTNTTRRRAIWRVVRTCHPIAREHRDETRPPTHTHRRRRARSAISGPPRSGEAHTTFGSAVFQCR